MAVLGFAVVLWALAGFVAAFNRWLATKHSASGGSMASWLLTFAKGPLELARWIREDERRLKEIRR